MAFEAIDLILYERTRQIINLGYDFRYDKDNNSDGSLAIAGAYYALTPELRKSIDWPWNSEFKPSNNRIRELIKAGALIAAEIDRLVTLERMKNKGE